MVAEFIPIEGPSPASIASSPFLNTSLVLALSNDFLDENLFSLRSFWVLDTVAANTTSDTYSLPCDDTSSASSLDISVMFFGLPPSGLLETMGRLLVVGLIQIAVSAINNCIAKRATDNIMASQLAHSGDSSTGFAGSNAAADEAAVEAAKQRLAKVIELQQRHSDSAKGRDSDDSDSGTSNGDSSDTSKTTLDVKPKKEAAPTAVSVSALTPSAAMTAEDASFYLKMFWQRYVPNQWSVPRVAMNC